MANEYSTSNLYEAAFLLCQGHKLAGKEGKAVVFSAEAKKDSSAFYNGASVDAKTFASNYDMIQKYLGE